MYVYAPCSGPPILLSSVQGTRPACHMTQLVHTYSILATYVQYMMKQHTRIDCPLIYIIYDDPGETQHSGNLRSQLMDTSLTRRAKDLRAYLVEVPASMPHPTAHTGRLA
jgi:hypothetical protein